MSIQFIGNCADCSGGICTMNCSTALVVTGSEWIAASIWAGVFPAKASAAQVKAYRDRAEDDPSHCSHCDGFGTVWNNADPTSGQSVNCENCGGAK